MECLLTVAIPIKKEKFIWINSCSEKSAKLQVYIKCCTKQKKCSPEANALQNIDNYWSVAFLHHSFSCLLKYIIILTRAVIRIVGMYKDRCTNAHVCP